jgi:NAD(P)-dependent dehydrogenase (short-subunit alcohol dehydrogenase family)
MGRLEGKVSIVTGAASGFGRATAVRFAAEAAQVVVADLDEMAGQQTVDEIRGRDGAASLVVGDVSDSQAARSVVAEAVTRFGALHILVNNAGVAQGVDPKASWDAPEETWDRVVRVNLRSVYACSRAAVPAMVAAGGGAIVNVASIAATVSVGGSGYAATKGGILSYTRHIAAELAPAIRANCVSPGFMRTPMSTGERKGLSLEEQEQRMASYASYNPMRRAGSADDIASAVLFLASDEAGYITGQELVVDGGHLVWSH